MAWPDQRKEWPGESCLCPKDIRTEGASAAPALTPMEKLSCSALVKTQGSCWGGMSLLVSPLPPVFQWKSCLWGFMGTTKGDCLEDCPCRFGGAQKQHPMEGAKSGEQRGQREAGPYRTREAHRTRGTQELRAASPRLIAMACCKGVCIEGSDCVF